MGTRASDITLSVLPNIHTLRLDGISRDAQLRTLLGACPTVVHVEVEDGADNDDVDDLSLLTIGELCPRLGTLSLRNFPFHHLPAAPPLQQQLITSPCLPPPAAYSQC